MNSPPSKGPRVLILAEACNPEWQSVPLVGWSHAEALARATPCHLVTQVRNRAAIERFGWREGEEFTAIDTERVAKPVSVLSTWLRRVGLGWTSGMALTALSYRYFERRVWRRFRDDLQAGRFDVVQRLTPMSPTAPSPLAAWCARIGVPFVWGPMNGGLPWPKGSGAVQRREGEWLSYVRDLYKLIPGYRASRRHARALVIGSTATWEQMPPRYRDHCVFVPENGIDPARFPDRPVPDGDRPLRVAFVGRLVEWKGCGTLIEAMAPMIGAGGATLVVIGDGPDRGRLERLAQRHRLGDGVEFRGWVDHHNVHGILGGCHVLGFPSIREFGGGVVLEAMALGVVPVVIDYGGPAELVTVDTGRKVPFGDTGAMVEGVRQALLDLASDPEGTRRMAQAAKDRVAAHFTWDRKAQQSLAIHRWVLSGGGPPPELVPVEVPLPRG